MNGEPGCSPETDAYDLSHLELAKAGVRAENCLTAAGEVNTSRPSAKTLCGTEDSTPFEGVAATHHYSSPAGMFQHRKIWRHLPQLEPRPVQLVQHSQSGRDNETGDNAGDRS